VNSTTHIAKIFRNKLSVFLGMLFKAEKIDKEGSIIKYRLLLSEK
jgi:hypothetical protein